MGSTSKRKELENELTNLHDELKKIDGEKLEQEKLQFTQEHSKIEYEKELITSDLKHCKDEYETALRREQNSLNRLRNTQSDMKSDELKKYKRLENRNADAKRGVDWLKG